MLQLNDSALLKKRAYINGEWFEGCHQHPIKNPANDEQIATVPDLGAFETQTAIVAADDALRSWRKVSAKERAVLLKRWYTLILEHQEDLARLMTAEQGKPLAEARAEIAYGASFIEWFAEEGKRAYGDVIPAHHSGQRIMVTREPVGVVAAITPLEFPQCHDCPKSCSSTGGRLYCCYQTCGGYAFISIGNGRTG